MLGKFALVINDCEDCNSSEKVCELHNPIVKTLDLPPKKSNPNEGESSPFKGKDTDLQVDTMGFDLQAAGPSPGASTLSYVKQKRMQLQQLLNTRGEDVVVGKVIKDLKETVPGAAQANTSVLAGIIVKYLIQAQNVREGHKVQVPFNDSQFLHEIEPVLERKQASMKPEIYCPNCGEEALSTKPGHVSCPECNYKGPDEIGGGKVAPKMKNVKATRKMAIEFVDEGLTVDSKFKAIAPYWGEIEDRMKETGCSFSEAVKAFPEIDESFHRIYHDNPKNNMMQGLASLKSAATGGANEEEPEEEEEPENTLDSSVVALLDSCKNEWTSLGEPVNPGTWPKEIERAILDLNDSVVKAIETIQGKLVEGEYYIKNVDEGVDSGGGSAVMMNDLNIAPPEPGASSAPEEDNMAGEKPKPEIPSPNSGKMGSNKEAISSVGFLLLNFKKRWAGLSPEEKQEIASENGKSLEEMESMFGSSPQAPTKGEAFDKERLSSKTASTSKTALRALIENFIAWGKAWNAASPEEKEALAAQRNTTVEEMNKIFTPETTAGFSSFHEHAQNGGDAGQAPKNVQASKKAAVEVTSTETKKALKFVEGLQDKVAEIFFEYKKTVETANNSALVKSGGEDMVRLKSKLSEVEKVLDKQFNVLEAAEESVVDKKKASSVKKQEEAKGKKPWETTPVKNSGSPDPSIKVTKAPSKNKKEEPKKEKKEASIFMGLNLSGEE